MNPKDFNLEWKKNGWTLAELVMVLSLVSMLIVARAVSAGVPRVAVARMVANIAIDSLLGTAPFVGDLFDFAYKANTKNVRIYEESLAAGRAGTGRHWGFFALLALGLVAVVAIPLTVAMWLMSWR